MCGARRLWMELVPTINKTPLHDERMDEIVEERIKDLVHNGPLDGFTYCKPDIDLTISL